MATFTLAFLLFATVIGAMSIGIMFGRPRIEGSCGGLNRIAGVESDCGGRCRQPCEKSRSAG